jgi:hypothetical protein
MIMSVQAMGRTRRALLVQDFAHEIIDEWKGWLTGSLPMAGLAIAGLVDPEWIRFPLWAWVLLIFVAGLFFAMFRVYGELRRQRDILHQRLGRLSIAGPYLLVPYSPDLEERMTNDL